MASPEMELLGVYIERIKRPSGRAGINAWLEATITTADVVRWGLCRWQPNYIDRQVHIAAQLADGSIVEIWPSRQSSRAARFLRGVVRGIQRPRIRRDVQWSVRWAGRAA